MTAPVKKKWMLSDVELLIDMVANPEDYPEKFTPSHLFLEDLRKAIILLEQPHMGGIDEEAYEWCEEWIHDFPYLKDQKTASHGTCYKATNPHTGFEPGVTEGWEDYWEVVGGTCRPEVGEDPDAIYKISGEWIVAVWDESHGMTSVNEAGGTIAGRWVFWQNNIDITMGQAHACLSPPAIHPEYTIWDNEENYVIDQYVSYPLLSGPSFYKAKRNNNGKQPDISPDDWEVVPIWTTDLGFWKLSPSPNRYHDWGVNFPGEARKVEVVIDDGEEIVRNEMACQPYKFYPKQTDPKTQFPAIIYADTQQKDFQYKEKVTIKKEYISNPAMFGAKFTSWHFTLNDATPPNGVIIKNGLAMDWKTKGAFYGNQYAHTGLYLPFYNYPYMYAGNWSYNPKVASGDLQSRIECALDAVGLRMPATDAFRANWRKSHFVDWVAGSYTKGSIRYQPDDGFVYMVTSDSATSQKPPGSDWRLYEEDESSLFESYPLMTALEWECNESAFELAKRESGKYDLFFQTTLPYVPSVIAEKITLWRNGVPTPVGYNAETWEPTFDCSEQLGTLKGSWRRSWKYSMGRVSPFMRSQEMEDPEWDDVWNPSDPLGILGDSYYRWFGSHSRTFPALNTFDDKFRDITKIADRIFEVEEDLTSILRAGFMIHFCAAEDQLIEDDGDILPAYVMEISFADGKTTIKTSEDIGDFTKIGWNKEISERHDPVHVYYDEDDVLHSGYACTPEMLLEMFELLNLNFYIETSVTLERARGGFPSYDGPFDPDNFKAETIGEYLGAARADMMSGFDLDVDNNEKWAKGEPVGGMNLGAFTACFNYPNGVAGPPPGYNLIEDGETFFSALALKATWIKLLKNLPKYIWVLFVLRDSYKLPLQPWYKVSSQEAGPLETPAIVDEYADTKLHYLFVRLEADGEWHFFIPKIKFAPYGVYDNYAGTPPAGFIQIGGNAVIIIHSISVANSSKFIEKDYEDVPDDVWEPNYIGHLDAPITPIEDNIAPRPNPPIFHTVPQADCKFVRPFYPGQFETWVSGNSYYENDYRTVGPELFRAKQTIINKTIYPQNNPAEWEWQPPKFQLRITAESCLCNDYEGSTPVKYRMVGLDDAPTSDYSTSKEIDAFVKDLPLPAPRNILAGATTNPSGTITKIYHSGSPFTADALIEPRHTKFNDGLWRILTVGSDGGGSYFTIDKGWYQEEIFYDDIWSGEKTYAENEYTVYPDGAGHIYRSKVDNNLNNQPDTHSTEWEDKGSVGSDAAYAIVYNYSAIYSAADWATDEAKDYQFKLQAKDSASPQNNETALSEDKGVTEAEEYPAEMIEDAGGLEGLA